ncbi:DUF3515 domain-containing protein [Streptomyces lonarensis]|uniref:DUF3515 domain-containing protein n=1 Tax=Streptomyces lonarensis TaxID=700599 RepID=A0A7X6CXZ0_9ACTN|nr:DUF3515 domain-containing protein [Streptomyces lonarensis]
MVALVAACGSSAELSVEDPQPDGEAAEVCEAVVAALPATVEGEEARDVAGPARFTAAWGDPAIVLRCGAERPAVLTPGSDTYRPTADAVMVDDVSWLLEESDGGHRFTTTERTVFVEVDVPDSYAPEVNALVDVAEALHEHLPYDPLWEDYYEDSGAPEDGAPGDGNTDDGATEHDGH